MSDNIDIKAIAANLDALNWRLHQAAVRANEAHNHMRGGDLFEAIGTILGIDRDLEDALALYRAALTLHKRRAS